MAKGKRSRKGKKEWRKNISTAETDAQLELESRQERQGGPVNALQDEQLFFLDKSKDKPAAVRKTERHRSKLLHCDLVLKRSSLVPPVGGSQPSKTKAKGNTSSKVASKAVAQALKSKLSGATKLAAGVEAGLRDAWSTEEAAPQGKKPHRKGPATEPWRGGSAVCHEAAAAVEVDAPGCSFNPSFQDHQDSLAEAVAQEVRKELRKELLPEPVPLSVVAPTGNRNLMQHDEEEALFEDADLEEEGEDDDEGREGEEQDEEAGTREDIEGEEGERASGADLGTAIAKPVTVNRLTRADLNKRERKRTVKEAETKEQKRKRLLAEVDRVDSIQQEIDQEEAEVAEKKMRKVSARKERERNEPPRLGKHRFEPEPVQVLLTEDVSGSLRKLKGCSTLVRDRFKSFQRRGILEPRVRVRRKAAKNVRVVEQGSKGNKEREMHAETLALRAARDNPSEVMVLQ